jgi:hypothetical protein
MISGSGRFSCCQLRKLAPVTSSIAMYVEPSEIPAS